MNKKLKHFVFICLTSSVITSPTLIHAVPEDMVENGTVTKLNSSIQKHKIPNSNQPAFSTTNTHGRKATLNDDSRGLSGFFILGIIINIIMVITFGRWFSKEWRRSKK